jgi:hypothetical protein
MAKKRRTAQPGIGLDASGGPLIDPTANVIALNEAGNIRQDDLRRETNRRIDSELRHLKAIVKIHARHQKSLRKAESQRLDSIRQVDREDVNKTAAQALSAIATLATATTTTAETLRGQVATTAQAAATSLANSMGEVNKRLSALELSSSEGRGKATVESPMMAEMVAEIKAMRREQAASVGQRQGTTDAQATQKVSTTFILLIAGLILSMIVGAAGIIFGIIQAMKP